MPRYRRDARSNISGNSDCFSTSAIQLCYIVELGDFANSGAESGQTRTSSKATRFCFSCLSKNAQLATFLSQFLAHTVAFANRCSLFALASLYDAVVHLSVVDKSKIEIAVSTRNPLAERRLGLHVRSNQRVSWRGSS